MTNECGAHTIISLSTPSFKKPCDTHNLFGQLASMHLILLFLISMTLYLPFISPIVYMPGLFKSINSLSICVIWTPFTNIDNFFCPLMFEKLNTKDKTIANIRIVETDIISIFLRLLVFIPIDYFKIKSLRIELDTFKPFSVKK